MKDSDIHRMTEKEENRMEKDMTVGTPEDHFQFYNADLYR